MEPNNFLTVSELDKKRSDDLMEFLADKEHDSWARWMRYLFSKCVVDVLPSGAVVTSIPAPLCERWMRQAITPYAELSEQEKQSDREEVLLIWGRIVEETRQGPLR